MSYKDQRLALKKVRAQLDQEITLLTLRMGHERRIIEEARERDNPGPFS